MKFIKTCQDSSSHFPVDYSFSMNAHSSLKLTGKIYDWLMLRDFSLFPHHVECFYKTEKEGPSVINLTCCVGHSIQIYLICFNF